MKIAVVGSLTSIHTVQWCEQLALVGHEVHAFTVERDPPRPRHVTVHDLPVRGAAGYVLDAVALRRRLRRLDVDVVHAHYATGNGTLAVLAAVRPVVVSVYGSDVYDFPHRSAIHRRGLLAVLRRADAVCSTSEDMARAVRQVGYERPVAVVPFGVDVERFAVRGSSEQVDPDGRCIVVGTVKVLDRVYGVDLLLEAIAEVHRRLQHRTPPGPDLRAVIVGDGPERRALEALATRLGIEHITRFDGWVPHAAVPGALLGLDVYVALSRAESFGVAVVEASATGAPVVVSRVGGLPEVVDDGETGLVVAAGDVGAAADAIERLVLDPSLRAALGQAGAERMRARYGWDRCRALQEDVYREVTR